MTRAYCPNTATCRAGARGPCILCQPGSGRPRNVARRERVRAAYRGGATLRAIAAAEGVTYQRIHQILAALGEAMRPRGGRAA